MRSVKPAPLTISGVGQEWPDAELVHDQLGPLPGPPRLVPVAARQELVAPPDDDYGLPDEPPPDEDPQGEQRQPQGEQRRDLTGDLDPHGTDVHQVANQVESFRWLLAELGTRGLSGMLLRSDLPVYCSMLNEEGYVPPARKKAHNGPATIRQATAGTVTAQLALNYLVWNWSGKGDDRHRKERFFPADAVKNALEAIDKAVNLRPLKGVTHTPMVRRDATILTEPGYDDETGFLYLPTVAVPDVPARPTVAQTAAATALLRGLIDEFAWAGEHDEANFLGLLLTPLLRELCPPPYKMGAIMARQPGSGKSLLNEILRTVHGGVFRSEMPHDDAELEKSLSSILTQTTAPVVQFDNVSGTLRSSRLAGLLTSPVYSGRLLGSTNNVDMVNDRLWTITGNNLNLGGDLVRRTVWVCIDPRCPDPEKRTGFRLNIPEWLGEHRGDVLHALLVLVSAWRCAGMERPAEASSDGYSRWIATVRGILSHAQVPGQFASDESVQQKIGADDEGWGVFLEAIHGVMGSGTWTVRDLVARMSFGADTGEQEALVDALPAVLNERYHARGPASLSQQLGIWVKNRNGRFAGRIVCEEAGTDTHLKAKLWRIRCVDGTA